MTPVSSTALSARPRQHSVLGLILAAGVMMALLVGLGLWQLRRLAWKTALVTIIAERTTAPPVALPPETAWSRLLPGEYAYRHVTLTGAFEHDKEAHVFRPLVEAKGPAHGLGYLVLTPMRLASGAHVVVNRGFVPSEKLDPAARVGGQVEGVVTLTGLMREPEPRNMFTPADEPARGVWFTRDPASIAGAFHLGNAAPFTVDADASSVPGGLPQGGETILDIPNNHLSYAVTWFGLALGLLGVVVAYVGRRTMLKHTR